MPGGRVLVANSSCATPRFTDQALVKPWSRQPPLSPWQAHNAHCINVQRSSAAALWGESSDRCIISVHDAQHFLHTAETGVGRSVALRRMAHSPETCLSIPRRGRKFVGIDLGRVGEVAGPSGGLHGRCPDVSMRRHSVKMGRRASFNGKLDARWMRLATAGS